MNCFSKLVAPKPCAGFVIAFSVAVAGSPTGALADGHMEEDHMSGHRSVSSHEHGAAQMGIAVEGQSLHVNFTSPAMNIIGFERMAESTLENEMVAEAIGVFQNPSALFSFEGTACDVSDVSVHAEGVLPEENETHGGAEDSDHKGHAEFDVTYVFTCGNLDDMTGMTLNFFDVWPGIEEVETVYLGNTQTKSFELTASSNRLDLN